MKPILIAAVLTLALGVPLSAQPDIRQDVNRLNLTEAQVQQVVQIVKDTGPELERLRAEAKVTQAKLARLLVEDTPNRGDLEKLVKEGSDWDYKIKMARIDRSLKIRAVTGKDGWALLSHLSQRVMESEKSGKKPLVIRDEDKGARRELLQILRELN